jgi:hypothetical protein
LPQHSSADSKQPETATGPGGLSRRGFLGGLGGAAAAAAAGSLALEPLLPGGAAAGADHAGPLIGQDRLDAAYARRIAAAERMFAGGVALHECNGDETLYPNRIGSFTKGLPHDANGEVDGVAYQALLDAVTSGDPSDFELIPLGGARKMVNPQAGLAFDTEGDDPHQFTQPPAPPFASAWEAGEMVELYWMALLRDVHVAAFGGPIAAGEPLVRRAARELSELSDFRGPKIGGAVTRQTLFRDPLPGALAGPYISQFLLRGTPFGAEYVERRMRCPVSGDDHMTSFGEWLAVQNGDVPGRQTFDPVRRYVHRTRDLSEWVHVDVLFQAYFNAGLILAAPPEPRSRPTRGGLGCPANPGNPYLASQTQEGFGTWGPPGFAALLCEVASRALKAVWHQKWFVHRRLRPEEFGGRVHVNMESGASYPIHPEVLESEALRRVRDRFGSYLLPMVFPEGSPIHPSYGAGHATVAGACVTVLKALFDESFEIPDPVMPSPDGVRLVRYTAQPSVPPLPLTVGGELNKLASNVATGRNHAGVHWRSDAIESLELGEAVAVAVLEDHLATFNEGGGFRFTGFDGEPIVLGS